MKDMKRVHDLTGQKFGRLTVIGIDDTKQTRKTFWICECECGSIISTRSDRLISNRVKSCGCYKRESDQRNVMNVPAYKKYLEQGHKVGGTRLYAIWQNMRHRCDDVKNSRYADYGGRGIKVCQEWEDEYINFYIWAMGNGYADDLTIDRIDVDGNYEPSNCRWATNTQQCNNRRSNINITIGNATKSLKEWCDIFELPYKNVNARYHRNESITLDELFK